MLPPGKVGATGSIDGLFFAFCSTNNLCSINAFEEDLNLSISSLDKDFTGGAGGGTGISPADAAAGALNGGGGGAGGAGGAAGSRAGSFSGRLSPTS